LLLHAAFYNLHLIDVYEDHTMYKTNSCTLNVKCNYIKPQITVADPEISERRGAVEGRRFGGCLEAPSGTRAKPWWGSRRRSPGKLTNSYV
jgi:hypothetical protein